VDVPQRRLSQLKHTFHSGMPQLRRHYDPTHNFLGGLRKWAAKRFYCSAVKNKHSPAAINLKLISDSTFDCNNNLRDCHFKEERSIN